MSAPTGSLRSNRETTITAALILGIMMLGAVVLAVEASTEPYHIDELRQVGYYDQSVGDVVEDSFGMEQPPLDMVTNSLVQRVIGVGDLRQRAVSVALGVGSIGLVGVLALLAGMGRWGAVAAATTLALSPTTISVTAYARPYALPTFLVLTSLTITIMWLKSGRIGWAIGLVITSAALLLARPTEPYLFLVVAPAVLFLWQLVRRQFRWIRVLYVAGVAGGALLFVGRPILGQICGEVDQCRGFSVSVLSQVTRLWTDAPQTVIDVLWQPLLLLLAIVVFLAVPRARNSLASRWWFWALTLTSVAASAAFFVLSDPELGFSAKYTYLYFVSLALVIGSLVYAAVTGSRETRSAMAASIVSGVVAAVVILALASSTWATVTTRSRIHYGELAAFALAEAPDRVIITDSPRDLGRWRPWMYGRGRYYPVDAPFVRVDDVVYNPEILDTSLPPAVLLIGVKSFEIGEPFAAIETPNGTLVLDPDAAPGPTSAAAILSAVGRSIGGNRGSTPSLAGAFVNLAAGNVKAGCVEVFRVESDPAVPAVAMRAVLAGGWYFESGDLCSMGAVMGPTS